MPEASAPGKLLLTGEYAVLRGAPAISVSVDVRAIARAGPGDGPSALEDAASARRYPFSFSAGSGLRWLDEEPGDRGRLPTAVFDTLSAVPGVAEWPSDCSLSLDTDAFVAAGQSKYGLGSSAALTVALTAVAASLLRIPTDGDTLLPLAIEAHRRFQRGSGSGVDIVTAVRGGLVCVRPGDDAPGVDVLPWPEGLHMLLAWSGYPASTPARIAAFDQFAATPPAVAPLALLDQAAQAAAAAWQSGDTASILSATEQFARQLYSLDEAGDIGILTDEHLRLAAISRAAGAVYKTSGAGGGDLGFALADDPAIIDRLRREFSSAGFDVLELATGVGGLLI